jgi:formylmethanofuran dehydrogenase subunit C
VSDAITLSLRAGVDEAIDLDGVTADRLAALPASDIAALPVRAGGRPVPLGDLFDVRGEQSDRVRVEGSLARVDGLGAAMRSGELIIDGDAGQRVGAGMTGGLIDVRGNAGDEAGVAMAGGTLRIGGNGGHRCGAAAAGASRGMSGGELIVTGSVGDEVAARARRGLVVVGGDAGEQAARAMIAGTLIVFGRTGARAGRGSKRGSIVAIGGIDVPPTYRYACTFQPPHLRLTLTYLSRRYGLSVETAVLDGRYRRYCGDAGDVGKGEILEWVADGR